MLLEQLVRLAERLEAAAGEGEALPFMYQEGPVRWMLHLDADGNLERVVPTSDGSGKKNDRGKRYATPHVVRTSGIKPKLLADNAEFALGLATDGADPTKVRLKHEAFKAEILACEEATGLPQVRAVRQYLERLLDAPLKPPEGLLAKDVVSFIVDGKPPFELPAVRAYWAGKFSTAAPATPSTTELAATGALVAECLISGAFGPVMNREPVKVKGLPGGQTSGMSLISANKGAFESYGLSASQVAPVRLELAEKYANALNSLLRDPASNLRVGPAVYAFWTRRTPTPPVVETLRNPKGNARIAAWRRGEPPTPREARVRTEQARDTIRGAFSGRAFQGLEPDEFYGVALSASGGRVVVREHITSTVQAVDDAIADFFAAQSLVGCEPMGIFELAASLYRDANKEMVPAVVTALVGFALRGTPLPWSWLQKVAARNRAEARTTRPRAVTTKLVLVSNRRVSMDELEALAPDNPDPGYQLGRLLAALEGLQRDALGDLNATVVDRYWGAMSSTPVVAFPRLLTGARSHLAKLRKDTGLKGRAVANEKLIQDITGRLGTVPATLSLESQALFGLGYYHQRAERFERIEAAKAARRTASIPASVLTNNDSSTTEPRGE